MVKFNHLNNIQSLIGSTDSLRGKLIRGSLNSLSIKGGYLVLQFAIGIFLARALGPEEYGVYAFALAAVALMVIPAELGFTGLVVRMTAIYNENKNFNLLKGLWSRAIFFVILSSSLIITIGALIINNIQLSNTISPSALNIAFFLVPFLVLIAITESSLRGLGYVVLGQLPSQIFRPAIFILIVVLLYLYIEINAIYAILSNLIASVIVMIIGWKLLRIYKPGEVSHVQAKYLNIEWLTKALPFFLLAGGQVINHHTDLIMVGILMDQASTGLYRVAIQIADAMVMVLMAISVVIAPYLAGLHSTRDWMSIEKILINSHRVGFAILLPFTVFIVLFATPFISFIFGSDYIPVANALKILAIGKILYATVGFSGIALSMFGYASAASLFTLLIAVLNIAMNFILVPIYGLEGAAFATAVSTLLVNLIMVKWLKSKLSLRVSAFEQLRSI